MEAAWRLPEGVVVAAAPMVTVTLSREASPRRLAPAG